MTFSSGKLTAKKVETIGTPGRYGDGGGLWLQVSSFGTKSWIFRYTFAGCPRHMGLGDVRIGSRGTVTLAQARELARAARFAVLSGIDPIAERRAKKQAARAEAAKRITFKEAAEKFIASHKAAWKNEKHAAQWPASFETYAYPVIGSFSVAAVDTAHVMRILEPIWTTKTVTASRLRGRIEAVLDWAGARQFRQGENPARWRGHLDKLLPAKTKVQQARHQPAMAFAEVPIFMAELRAQKSITARALEFTVLTAARTGEVIGAKWDEIDSTAKVWIVPGARTKSGRKHRVPLSERALTILANIPREKHSPFVFPGGRVRKPLSNMAMLELLRDMRTGLTVHGFRSSFRDWAGERTAFPREIAEAALGHVVGDKTEAAYRRGDALEKRRRLMTAWDGYCASKGASAGEVVPMRKTAARS